ncbi:cytochrome b-c1 complex subunit 8-like [Orycteropus afer afer]|uniref:Cytochrome b-c1 complex subunit 8-like n=1 Tax=Orycteropus afer afer TaxID=1230840 RepID=A0AC54ZBH3_ORYAF|nr:cytochrome b-c1 complex subunit 8-like [Orycteropus afer afer]
MGSKFGNLERLPYVITYSLSPFEQGVFPHYFSNGIPNMLHHTQASILGVMPRFVVFYLVYIWGTQELKNSKRNTPAAYENNK